MRSCILAALCSLLLQLASAHMAVPCQGTTYYDCYHYCRGSCHGRECFHRCNSGCGCQEAFIVRNNGACRKLEVCQVGDDDEDSHNGSLPQAKVGGGSPQFPPAGPDLGRKLAPGSEDSKDAKDADTGEESTDDKD
ncbi:uncharacterized protein LOC117590073 [Drosophila guanche]|uniref:TIL domain-containing protein n=1 Tax=Drosophila guanche TaxID=7266 RepID=A0A3B0JNK5_DROGU|nr:uncharacterized protein LOC117590073 [Drosophila guanche]SPP72788.1 Hypothetical predicted protein [Drosophila guanche]